MAYLGLNGNCRQISTFRDAKWIGCPSHRLFVNQPLFLRLAHELLLDEHSHRMIPSQTFTTESCDNDLLKMITAS